MPIDENSSHNHQAAAKLQLHKEEFEVSKKWVETADVKVYTNTYSEEKLIVVPITHEELVIEKRMIPTNGKRDEQTEIVRIPLSEERIKVTKQPVILEDVDVYKKQFEELVHINEILKEEKVRIESIGDIKIIDESE